MDGMVESSRIGHHPEADALKFGAVWIKPQRQHAAQVQAGAALLDSQLRSLSCQT